MFGFSVSNDMKERKKKEKKNVAYLLAYFLARIVKILKINVEHGRVVTTLNIIKH